MAKYSFQELTNVLGGKKKLSVIAGITSVVFLFGGCISSVARLAGTDAPVAATTADPKVALYGTYYGYNGSVLILKDDGNADYFYTGQNDVKHSNSWSLQDNEITINMSWMFCTVKGTVESDPVSFVLVGNSDIDDFLWDDERFEKVSDDTSAMTKADCESFIADHSGTGSNNIGNNAGNGSTEVSYKSVDVHGSTFLIPEDFNLTSGSSDADRTFVNASNTGLYEILYSETDIVVSNSDFSNAVDSTFGELETSMCDQVNYDSVSDRLICGCYGVEFTIDGISGGEAYHIKGLCINASDRGYIIMFCAAYTDDAPFVADCYEYTLTNLQLAGSGTSSAGGNNAGTSGSTNVREVLDQYEAFMNEYIAFMQTYNNASPDQAMDMMDDYLDLMEEYVEMEEMLDSLDVTNMSDEDYAYYLEVTTRVAQNLLSIY